MNTLLSTATLVSNKCLNRFFDAIESYSDIYETGYILSVIEDEIMPQLSIEPSNLQKYLTDNTADVLDGIIYSTTSTEISVNCQYINSQIFRTPELSTISSIYLMDDIQYIHDKTFKALKNLRRIHLPSKLKVIKSKLFYGCEALEQIELPEELVFIEHAAFENCSSLSSIVFNNSLKFIGDNAFKLCSNIASLALPDSIAVICNSFKCCGQIDVSCLSKNIKCMLPYVFNGTTIKSISCDDALLLKFKHAFKRYTLLKTLKLS